MISIKNNKVIGIIDTILIVIGIGYDIARVFTMNSIGFLPGIIFQIIAYCFALDYAFRGHKKDAAKSYKRFLFAFALSMLITLIRCFYKGNLPMSFNILSAISLLFVLVLAFKKDFGKRNSYILAFGILLLSIAKIVIQYFSGLLTFESLFASLSSLIISITLCIFVIAKYIDKESRGSK